MTRKREEKYVSKHFLQKNRYFGHGSEALSFLTVKSICDSIALVVFSNDNRIEEMLKL